ncbi:GNAT family N-acetyltransferase [Paenibacillaceae bacterium WGS1546]|uniref:GNAT family N-acetyltransferase n=1 Tax=Cohnella sp. WGS1546 TaxID=3366810 RepID=UPI00372D418F
MRRSLSLRPAAPRDEMLLRNLYASARQEEVSGWGWTPEQTDAFLHMQWNAQRSSYMAQFPNAVQSIVLQAQQPVGQCYVDYAPDHLRLIDLSILPPFRNRGIGSQVLRNLQLEATRRRIPVLLSVTIENPARRLYERLGFILAGSAELYASMRWQPPNLISTEEGKLDE